MGNAARRATDGRPPGARGYEGPGERPEASRADRAQPPDQPTHLPKAGWVAIAKRSVREFKHDNLTDLAAALTYYGLLALFPATLVLVSILGMLGESTTQQVLDNVGQLAPGGVYTFLHGVVTQVQGRAGAASVAGVIGLVIALWSASGYVTAFMRAANTIYEVDEGRPIWKTAPLRLATTLALVVMLVLAAAIVVLTGPVAEQVGKAFGIGHTAVLVWDIAKWPVLLLLVTTMLALLYKATPNIKQPGLRWISPGGVLAVVIWLIASAGFAVYVGFSGSYNKTYGSFAAVIIFLVWLWITNIAILLGAEVNAEIQRERAIRGGLPADVEPFAELRDTRKLDDDELERVEHAAGIRRRHLH
jgi:membrane protein